MASPEGCMESVALRLYGITRQRVYHQHGNAVLYLITPLGVHKILSA